MKIGIFTECYKPMLNGVVNSIDDFRIGLTELGHEVYIFAPNYKVKVQENNLFSCKSYPLPGNSGYFYVYPLDERKLSIAKKMDIIHTEHPFIMGAHAEKAAKQFNIPLVFTNHTQYEQYSHYFPFGKSIVRYFIKKWVTSFANKCDLVIAPADGIRRKLVEYKINTPIEIVPNGINVNKFASGDNNYLKNKYHLEDYPVFVFVGRIAEEKNIEFLIRAFQNVNKDNPQSYLFLVGGGPKEKEYNNLITNLNLTGKAFITGNVQYEDIPDYLASSNIFVTASKTEVHPLTILEAMAAGLPAITFDTFGTGEMINNNVTGLKAKIDNSNDFENKMKELLQNPDLQKKLSENAKNYSRIFSISETSKRMVKAYEKAILFHNKNSKQKGEI